MKFLHRFRRTSSLRPAAYSLVDIGRDTVKAAVVLVIPTHAEPQIIGYGLAETGGHDITGGRLEADAATSPVNQALTQAEDSTERFIGQKIVPDEVIFALAGRATVGKLFTVRQTRPKPGDPIVIKELDQLRVRAERLVRQGLADLPVAGGHWQALAVTDAGFYLDRRLVLGGLGLTGREISFSVFGVAGQTGALRALEVLAGRLDLMITNIVAASQALAAVIPQPEAIILDVGLGGTDVCIMRDQALVAGGSTPFGGSFFTQALAQGLGLEATEAEALKQAFGKGDLPPGEANWIDSHLDLPRQRWYEAVMELLTRLALRVDAQSEIFDRPLPRRIFFTGGGSLLPGLDKLLRSDPAPFDRAPEVGRLGAGSLPAMQDLTDGLDYNLFMLALSLVAGLPAEAV
ncbi:MAG: cell division FtsA domain-containing protein [Chloroflexota bacterium]